MDTNAHAADVGSLFTDAEKRLSVFPETSRLLRYLADHSERPGFLGMRIRFLAEYVVESESRPEDGILMTMDDPDLVAEIAGFGIRRLNDKHEWYRVGDSGATADEAIDVIESNELALESPIRKRRCIDMSRLDAKGRTPSMELPRLKGLDALRGPWLSAEDAVALADGLDACMDDDMVSSCGVMMCEAHVGDGITVGRAMTMHPKDVPYDEWHRMASWIAAPDDDLSSCWSGFMVDAMKHVFDSVASVLAASVFLTLSRGCVTAPNVCDMLAVREYPFRFVVEGHNARVASRE